MKSVQYVNPCQLLLEMKTLLSANNFKNEKTQKVKYPNFYQQEIGTVWERHTQMNETKDPRVQSNSTSTLLGDFRKFCSETTLHGLIYIGQPELHVIERVFWGIAFFLGILASGGLFYFFCVQFTINPINVTFSASQASLDQVPFPAVTICSVNTVRKAFVNEITRMNTEGEYKTSGVLRNFFYHLDHVCLATACSFSNKLNFSSEGSSFSADLISSIVNDTRMKNESHWNLDLVLTAAAQSCEEMIILCRWEDETRNCKELFQPTLTDYGVCCTFNMAPLEVLQKNGNSVKSIMDMFSQDSVNLALTRVENWNKSDLSIDGLLHDADSETNSSEYPHRSKRSGLSYGLSFLINPDIGNYFCTSSDSAGFQLVSHSPVESADVEEYGLGIGPSVEAFVRVTPDITVADRAINILEPERRKCYLLGECSLKYFVNYTYGNCIDECLANMTYEDCGCISYFMIRDHSRNMCGPEDNHCTEKTEKEFVRDVIKRRCVNCLPTCTDISYTTKMTVRPMRRDKNIWRYPPLNMSADWTNQNVSLVHVYFGDDKVYPKIRKRLFSLTDLIAGTGGILGLCLGFSVLSGVELLYFLLFKVIGKQLTRE